LLAHTKTRFFHSNTLK